MGGAVRAGSFPRGGGDGDGDDEDDSSFESDNADVPGEQPHGGTPVVEEGGGDRNREEGTPPRPEPEAPSDVLEIFHRQIKGLKLSESIKFDPLPDNTFSKLEA